MSTSIPARAASAARSASAPDASEGAGGAPRPPSQRFGLGVALVTPFARDGAVDLARLCAHARRVVDDGCSSVTLFGTTGEGASIGTGQRAAMLEAMDDAGFDLRAQVLAGVAASSVEDAAAQANQLYDAGGRGILLAPPFYFKGVGDEGLYRWFASVIERCREPREVIVYHIPSITSVPLSSPLIGRLKRAFPGIVTGVKDSSGEWTNTERLLADHADLHILVGDERQLARAMRQGGSGAINGFSNFCAREILPMVERGADVPGIAGLVDLLLRRPVTPGVKALVAHRYRDDAFVAVAPPLVPADDAARAELAAAFDRALPDARRARTPVPP
ncbi:4-hydroxy-tetrahydrodipicolinate synthase [Burkholderiales bacterium]|nr:4-hydroxy-tetrahydrodipicolinate synthase [Burkholderiales bacterium]